MHPRLNYKCKSELSRTKEAKKSPTDKEEVRPQALAQSYKDPNFLTN